MSEEEDEEFFDALDHWSDEKNISIDSKKVFKENEINSEVIITVKSNDKTDKSLQNLKKGFNAKHIERESQLIKSDDLEMPSNEFIRLLISIILIQISGLFIICAITHWIYNDLGGLDWTFESEQVFNFHAFFMGLGIFAFGIGLLSHRMLRGLTSGALDFLHTIITLMTSIFLFAGIYVAVITINSSENLHFYTIHSWIGLASIIGFVLEWIAGFVIFIFPKFIPSIQKLLIPIHTYLGRTVFALIGCTAILGISDKLRFNDLHHNWKNYTNQTDIKLDLELHSSLKSGVKNKIKHYWDIPDEHLLCNVIAIVILFYSLFIIYLSANEKFRRRLSPEEQGIEIKATVH